MKNAIYAALGMLEQAQYTGKIKNAPRHGLIQDVPYFSQWESPELVEQILTNKISAEDDPKWKASGAKNVQEYALWSANACGLACTKMILAKELQTVTPIVELAQKSLKYGVYTQPLQDSVGLLYKPYVEFMAAEFGMSTRVERPLSINQAIFELSQGNYILASVSPKIRNTNDFATDKGGHLVLLLGYDLDKSELYFHNPSGFKNETQSYAKITFADFKKFFGERGVIVIPSKNNQIN